MNLLSKIFWIAGKFSKQGNGKFVGGALIYFAQMLIAIPLTFIGIGSLVSLHAGLGLFVLVLMQLDVINEGDTMTDVWQKVFPLSYKYANDKASFQKALTVHIVAVLISNILATYATIGLVLLIVAYCKNNKKAKAAEEAKAVEEAKAE